MVHSINAVWMIRADGYGQLPYRTIGLCPYSRLIIAIEMTELRVVRRPIAFELDVFKKLVSSGEIQEVNWEFPAFMTRSEELLSTSDKKIRSSRFSIISEAMQDKTLPIDMALSPYSKLLAAYVKSAGVKHHQYCRLINLYWKFGSTQNALLPAFKNCGAKGIIRIEL